MAAFFVFLLASALEIAHEKSIVRDGGVMVANPPREVAGGMRDDDAVDSGSGAALGGSGSVCELHRKLAFLTCDALV